MGDSPRKSFPQPIATLGEAGSPLSVDELVILADHGMRAWGLSLNATGGSKSPSMI